MNLPMRLHEIGTRGRGECETELAMSATNYACVGLNYELTQQHRKTVSNIARTPGSFLTFSTTFCLSFCGTLPSNLTR